ncbi:MAG: hypothetical protein V4717_15105 [Bacteroidota bacterium]
MESLNKTLPELKSMTECVEKMHHDGYTNNFMATEEGLVCNETGEVFQPEQVKISNFFRFEGMSDPDDNSILYAIETTSGLKGTLVDGYGAFSDTEVNEFIKAVENITKKNAVAPEETS